MDELLKHIWSPWILHPILNKENMIFNGWLRNFMVGLSFLTFPTKILFLTWSLPYIGSRKKIIVSCKLIEQKYDFPIESSFFGFTSGGFVETALNWQEKSRDPNQRKLIYQVKTVLHKKKRCDSNLMQYLS